MNLVADLQPSPTVPHGAGVEFDAEMEADVVLASCPWVDRSSAADEIEAVPLDVRVEHRGRPARSTAMGG